MLVSVLILLTLFLSADSIELHPSCHSGQRLQQVTGLLVLDLAMREAWFGCLYLYSSIGFVTQEPDHS